MALGIILLALVGIIIVGAVVAVVGWQEALVIFVIASVLAAMLIGGLLLVIP